MDKRYKRQRNKKNELDKEGGDRTQLINKLCEELGLRDVLAKVTDSGDSYKHNPPSLKVDTELNKLNELQNKRINRKLVSVQVAEQGDSRKINFSAPKVNAEHKKLDELQNKRKTKKVSSPQAANAGDSRKINASSPKISTDLKKLNECHKSNNKKAAPRVADQGDSHKINFSAPKVNIEDKSTVEIQNKGNIRKVLPPQVADQGDSRAINSLQLTSTINTDLNKLDELQNKRITRKVVPPQEVDQNNSCKINSSAPKATDFIKQDELNKRNTRKVEKADVSNIYLGPEGRKRLREKYTIKLKSFQNLNNCNEINNGNKGGVTFEDCVKQPIEIEKVEAIESTVSTKNSIRSEASKSTRKTPKHSTVQRKPIIKTLNKENRVYKAVTFVDHKQTTPIQIKIPRDLKKEPKPQFTDYKITKPNSSKASVRTKPRKKERKRLNHRFKSPDTLRASPVSPPTEVAKWAPSCVNGHTKPYYEAWVDTTLAAITKYSKSDKAYLENQDFLKCFRKALEERSPSPDLCYENINDERFTGRIKVRRRQDKYFNKVVAS